LKEKANDKKAAQPSKARSSQRGQNAAFKSRRPQLQSTQSSKSTMHNDAVSRKSVESVHFSKK